MDLNTLRGELRKLSAIVEGWETPENITALERDLALGKLREIYDLVRFAEQVPAALPQPEAEASVSIDLDDVLTLGLIPDAGEEPEAELGMAAEVSFIAAEPEVIPEPVPVAEETPEPIAEMKTGRVSEPIAAPEPFTEVTLTTEKVEDRSEPESEVVDDAFAELESAPEPTVDPFFDAAPEPEVPPASVPEVPPASAPKPVLGSLFGNEDEDPTARHRRKQRVIMSLYGNDAPTSKFGSESESEDVFEEFSVETVKTGTSAKDSAVQTVEPAPAGDIAPDDESFGGDDPAPEPPAELDDPYPDGPAEEEPTVKSPDSEESPAPGAVLGEVMNHKVQTLADAYAAHPDTLSEAAHRAPIKDLRTVIGLNDRFLMIRDLFGGDAEACDAALDALNGFDNLDDCMIHIAENYNWNPDCDGAQFLMELLERKYA